MKRKLLVECSICHSLIEYNRLKKFNDFVYDEEGCMTCPICKFTAKWEVWGYEEEEEQEDVYNSDDATADDKNKKL